MSVPPFGASILSGSQPPPNAVSGDYWYNAAEDTFHIRANGEWAPLISDRPDHETSAPRIRVVEVHPLTIEDKAFLRELLLDKNRIMSHQRNKYLENDRGKHLLEIVGLGSRRGHPVPFEIFHNALKAWFCTQCLAWIEGARKESGLCEDCLYEITTELREIQRGIKDMA